ncbi:response regulator [Paenibacillus gorillae]|uniref:response regulator n=1 Tax=Paenibacillus gorillae TaxID=1243662 RepID=UPI0004AD681F|nr:response regulator [Paenibacillus gorillae]
MANIVIADHSIETRMMLRNLLEHDNHLIVGEAADGEEAYREYERTKPDLIILDSELPILDGMAVLRKILYFHPHAHILMISAVNETDMVKRAIRLGVKQFLVKPLEAESLSRAVQETLEQLELTQVKVVESKLAAFLNSLD